ncbi:hypothetical protein C7H19_08115 [Aphanothece hegewaldii CCALA 016]|uniref:Uncharacterized protein n=1 Tax=Aphanothece hegewaldii CCALA 016 TaxID=2107694 RepID=A0A2T1LZT0_9CHRO|nr:hypothetical protein [Aphanothece hegewaldii]PSF37931.1 hypothetical protein C7H19_08115 [Aphanothece hegewaldii CCALA 016]
MKDLEKAIANSPELFNCCYEEIIVAKRRNPKKEKAQRNLMYARQFRQNSTRTTGRNSSRQKRRES